MLLYYFECDFFWLGFSLLKAVQHNATLKLVQLNLQCPYIVEMKL